MIFTSFPADEIVQPRITFMEVPSRIVNLVHTFKDSQKLSLYIHPQGHYVGCMNGFMPKKTLKYSVELFDLKGSGYGSIPHQQIMINREVSEFHSITFEPQQGKVAVHTTSKKVLRAGEKQFSNDPNVMTVDMYQIKSDSLLGFVVKPIGHPNCEKIVEIHFSCVGNVFCTVEKETPTRSSLNFYIITKTSNEGQTTSAPQQSNKKGAKLITGKHLAAVEDTYEYRKTARYEMQEKKWVGKWQEDGRYFVLYGRKSSQFDKGTKTIKFFNMLGETLQLFKDIQGLESVQFRPRPKDILNKNTFTKLKKDYKKKYDNLFKNEEANEKKHQADIVKDQRKAIRDDFLNNFFIPLRQAYEKDINKYKAIFPIKETEIAEAEASYHNIYAFKETVSQRKIEGFIN